MRDDRLNALLPTAEWLRLVGDYKVTKLFFFVTSSDIAGGQFEKIFLLK